VGARRASILPLGIGALDLVVARHARAVPSLLHAAAAVNAAVFGVMTVIALRYWFLAPLSFLAVAFLCFSLAVAFGIRPAVAA
jgi:hypothetical protein